MIGVAGGSGSGKTTVVRRIMESIGDDQVTLLEHDRYYRDRNDLRLEERASLNYDHPDSLETDLLVRHLHELRAGRPVEAPVYDFARHARQPMTIRADPRRAIIVEGILIFSDASLRAPHARTRVAHTSRSAGVSSFESRTPLRCSGGATTAPTVTGPAHEPRPTSSIPTTTLSPAVQHFRSWRSVGNGPVTRRTLAGA